MIQLFRKGTSRIINGVTCDSILVNEFSYEPMLESGEWFLTPEECYQSEQIKESEEPEKPEKTPLEVKIEKAAKETKEALEAVEDLKKSSTKKKK